MHLYYTAFFRLSHFINNIPNIIHLNLHLNSYRQAFILYFSAPFKTYNNGKTYLVRREPDPSDSMNSQLYDDHPTRPCSHLGPLYRRLPVCQKAISAHDIIALHIFKHIPHYTCPPCLDFLSRGFKLCPVCKNPYLYFRLDASLIPASTIAQATPPSLPTPRRPTLRSPRRNSRQLQTEE